jgi:hypothetical protein
MRRFTFSSCAALLALAAGWSGTARAQITYPFTPPQFGPGYQTMLSPYLNFLRGGTNSGSAAANYFLGVLPEDQRRQYSNQFRGNISNLQILTSPLRNPLEEPVEVSDVPRKFFPSGHPTAFGYTGTFFGAAGSPLAAMRGTQIRPGGSTAPRRGYQPLGTPGMGGGGMGGFGR